VWKINFKNVLYFSVALNFQTPGEMMDLYDAKFRQNGGCGYVLKPSVMIEQIPFFSTNSRDLFPGLIPQFLHLKVGIFS
jgi:hypothetical protein